ncbi:phosphatidylinositol 3-kinase, root isoform, partial [Tanacetum coccineum]
ACANHPTDHANTTLSALAFCNMYLHNLLLRDDGCLFHVDFGHNLGRDPKSFPPPMKLCKEMQEAMGGAERTREAKTRRRLRILTNQSMRLMITNNSRKEGRPAAKTFK